MARPLRIAFPGAFYHVMARGNAKARIFLDEHDCRRFLEILGEVHDRFDLVCHTFCLMENHYHLVVETPLGNLSPAIRHLNGVYAQWWNSAHDRCGHLFQGRFKAQLIQRDRYLRAACRYVVLNPRRAGLVQHPRDWPWSSYRAAAGLEEPPRLLTTALLNSLIASPSDTDSCTAYEQFVLQVGDDLDTGDAIRRDARFLGTDAYWRQVRAAAVCSRARDVPKREFRCAASSLVDLLNSPSTRFVRNRRIWSAHFEFGYSSREIGRQLGLSPVTVRKILVVQNRQVLARTSG
jgi:putative transposase